MLLLYRSRAAFVPLTFRSRSTRVPLLFCARALLVVHVETSGVGTTMKVRIEIATDKVVQRAIKEGGLLAEPLLTTLLTTPHGLNARPPLRYALLRGRPCQTPRLFPNQHDRPPAHTPSL